MQGLTLEVEVRTDRMGSSMVSIVDVEDEGNLSGGWGHQEDSVNEGDRRLDCGPFCDYSESSMACGWLKEGSL